MDRLDDVDEDTRCEAIMGLARRKDLRVVEKLRQELESSSPTGLIFEAASELGDKSLFPLVRRHHEAIGDNTNISWLQQVRDTYKQLAK